ncbi:hypothetical protein HDV62DRAFT_290443 [Trichoderma sp. SZMC 28011]
MDPKTEAAEERPRLTFKELNIDRSDEQWIPAFRCVKMYHAQAMSLLEHEAVMMVKLIKEKAYTIQPTAKESPGAHKLYRVPKDRHQAVFYADKLEWVHYIILKAIYPEKDFDSKYMATAEGKFEDLTIDDMTNDYYRKYPDIGEEMRQLESTIESGHEQDGDGQDTLTMSKDRRQELILQLTAEDFAKLGPNREVMTADGPINLTALEFRKFGLPKRIASVPPLKSSIEKAEQAPAKASSVTPASSAKKSESATKKRNQDDFLGQTATELDLKKNTQSRPPTPVKDLMNSTPSRSTYYDSVMSNLHGSKRLKKSEEETTEVGHEEETTEVGHEKKTSDVGHENKNSDAGHEKKNSDAGHEKKNSDAGHGKEIVENLMQMATQSEASQRVILQKLEALDQKMGTIEQRNKVLGQRNEVLEQRNEALEQRNEALEQRIEAMEQRIEAMENAEKKNTEDNQMITLKMSQAIGEIKDKLGI